VGLLTGQHDTLLDPLIGLFGFERRIDLAARKPGDTLTGFAAHGLEQLGQCLDAEAFDAVVVQGDTTSALVGALAGAYAGIPVAHIEAGLRSGERDNPFPEDLNRRMIAETADWHFAPTEGAAQNLRREGFDRGIYVVGNTVVDAALWVADMTSTEELVRQRFPQLRERPHVLATAHRRESFGRPMEAIAEAIAEISLRESGTAFIVPLHPNPNASQPLVDRLCGIANVELTEPLSYPLTIGLVAGARMILTDSGGLQEEAPCFGVPVLVLRDVTERPEGIEAGCSRLAGTTTKGIVEVFERWKMEGHRPPQTNPYGDGRSGERIASILLHGWLAAGRPASSAA